MSVPIWINGIAYLPAVECETRVNILEAALREMKKHLRGEVYDTIVLGELIDNALPQTETTAQTVGSHPGGGPCIHVWALTNRSAIENGKCELCGNIVPQTETDDAPENLEGFDKPGGVFKIGGKVVSREEGLAARRERLSKETTPALKPCWCNAGCMLKIRGDLPASRYCKQARSAQETKGEVGGN